MKKIKNNLIFNKLKLKIILTLCLILIVILIGINIDITTNQTGMSDTSTSITDSITRVSNTGAGITGAIVSKKLGYLTGEIIVVYKKNVRKPRRQAMIREKLRGENKIAEGMNMGLENDNINKVILGSGETVESAITKLKGDPEIDYVQPNFKYVPIGIPNDPSFTNQWNFQLYGTGDTRNYGILSGWERMESDPNYRTGTIVAVFDTGVDYNHEDLKNVMWDGSRGCKDEDNNLIIGGCPYHGWNTGDDNNNTMDGGEYGGHGTQISGILGAEQNNGKGISGVGKGIKIMAIAYGGTSIGIARGIQFAQNNGAKVINASFGLMFVSISNSNPTLHRGGPEMIIYTTGSVAGYVYDRLIYESMKSFSGLIICGAGNNSDEIGEEGKLFLPADYGTTMYGKNIEGVTNKLWDGLENIISVANINEQGSISGTVSNYSKETVHIGSPGTNLISTRLGENRYANHDNGGTSSATPFLSGIVGNLYNLIAGVDIRIFDKNPMLVIKDAVLQGGDDVASLRNVTISGKKVNLDGSIRYLQNYINFRNNLINPAIRDCTFTGQIGSICGGGMYFGSGIIVSPKSSERSGTAGILIGNEQVFPLVSISRTDGRDNLRSMLTRYNINNMPAFKYCNDLNLGGFTGWYLPAIDELNFIATTTIPRFYANAGPFIPYEITPNVSIISSTRSLTNPNGYTDAFQKLTSAGLFSTTPPVIDYILRVGDRRILSHSPESGTVRCIRRAW